MSTKLSEPVKYTSFRINRLKAFDSEELRKILDVQKRELNLIDNPELYYLRPDCLILNQWPEQLSVEIPKREVIVDALCAAAVMRGAHVFAPGVMGLPPNCEIGEKVAIYGDVEGKCKRGLKIVYEGAKRFVGIGLLNMTRSSLFDKGVQPSGIAVHVIIPDSRIPVVNDSMFPPGEIVLQNLPSIVCGWVVDAKPDEIILDMCSAPGNKTTHLAEMSDDKAFIIAIDKTEPKIEKVRKKCEKHGITCVKAYAYDSTKAFSENGNEVQRGPPYAANSFDKILLDAPCSGLGQRPQFVNKVSIKMQKSYKFVQRKLFSAAVELLKPEGELIYSTCTTTIDENEGMVAWALDHFPKLKLVIAEPLLGGPGLPNVGLSAEQRSMVQRFSHEDDSIRLVEPIYKDTIGFFIAKFIKI